MALLMGSLGYALKLITPGTIIGGGRIGLMLAELNEQKDELLDKRDKTMTRTEGPIYVCTRNNDLDKIIADCPENRRADLVFLQNGILTKYLRSKKLSENTQGLIYFAVSKKGEKPIDGITDLNPEGLTAITGKWAEDFAARLHKGGLACHVLDKPTWTVAMLEKHIWICAFMAIGAKHKCTVGEVEKLHNEEVRALIAEMGRAAAEETKVVFPPGVADRLCAYARSVAHFPTALKEFEWRNGWFAEISFKKISTYQEDPLPLHTTILQQQGLFLKAKKAFVENQKREGLIFMEQWNEEKAYDEYKRAQDLQERKASAAKAAAENKGKEVNVGAEKTPEEKLMQLTQSPTILQKYKSRAIRNMAAAAAAEALKKENK